MANTSSSSPVQKAQAAAATAGAVSSYVDAAAVIAKTVASIIDANKRRVIESNLAYLDQSAQIKLAQDISKMNNANDRTTILVNTVMAARNASADRDQRAEIVQWVLLGTAGVVTLGIIAWYLKRK